MAKPESINHSRIRRDCETFLERCRSLVVLIEGRDLRCWSFRLGTWRNEPEMCEIGATRRESMSELLGKRRAFVLDVCSLWVWLFSSLIMVYETPASRTEGGNPLLIGRRGRVRSFS
jgi:hypothetical protein